MASRRQLLLRPPCRVSGGTRFRAAQQLKLLLQGHQNQLTFQLAPHVNDRYKWAAVGLRRGGLEGEPQSRLSLLLQQLGLRARVMANRRQHLLPSGFQPAPLRILSSAGQVPQGLITLIRCDHLHQIARADQPSQRPQTIPASSRAIATQILSGCSLRELRCP